MTKSEFEKAKASYKEFNDKMLNVELNLKRVTSELYRESNSQEKNNELLKEKEELSKKYLELMDQLPDVEENYQIAKDKYAENPEEDPIKPVYEPANPNMIHLE